MKKKANIFIVSLLLIMPYLSYSQSYIIKEYRHRISIESDSIFLHYDEPKIPKEFLNQNSEPSYGWSYTIVVGVSIDTLGKVKSIICNPLYNYGNKMPQKNKIWKEFINNIKEASQNWVFKPIYYEIKPDYSEKSKKYYEHINSGLTSSKYRPFGGMQWHLIVFEYDFTPNDDGCDPNLLYILRVSPK
ncbi:MAG: hypothetical protein WCT77_06630 [Bacteroidota bacterium]|jgi:hypothetical protein